MILHTCSLPGIVEIRIEILLLRISWIPLLYCIFSAIHHSTWVEFMQGSLTSTLANPIESFWFLLDSWSIFHTPISSQELGASASFIFKNSNLLTFLWSPDLCSPMCFEVASCATHPSGFSSIHNVAPKSAASDVFSVPLFSCVFTGKHQYLQQGVRRMLASHSDYR